MRPTWATCEQRGTRDYINEGTPCGQQRPYEEAASRQARRKKSGNGPREGLKEPRPFPKDPDAVNPGGREIADGANYAGGDPPPGGTAWGTGKTASRGRPNAGRKIRGGAQKLRGWRRSH